MGKDVKGLLELTERLGVGAFFFDQNAIVEVNQSFCDLVDRTAEELRGLSPASILDPYPDQSHTTPDERTSTHPLHGWLTLASGQKRPVLFIKQQSSKKKKTTRISAAVVLGTIQPHAESPDTHTIVSREWLELAQKAGQSICWEWHVDNDRMLFSTSAPDVLGVPASALPETGDEMLRAIPQDDQEEMRDALTATFSQGKPLVVEHRITMPDGEPRWVSLRGEAIRKADGHVTRVLGVSADVSDRKRVEIALREQQELDNVTLASIADGVVRTDTNGLVDYINPAACRLVGFSFEECRGRPLREIYRVFDETTRAPRPTPVERCLDQARPIVTSKPRMLLRSDDSELAVRDSASPLKNGTGEIVGAVLVFRDVTPVRNLEREMAHLATHDPLTGLINRREFETRLGQAIRTSSATNDRYALCYLDLDDFKIVNDTCGHSAGDQLLRQLTAVLDAAIRPGDTLARLGGDEFGILLHDCGPLKAQRLATALLDEVRRYRFFWEERVFEVGASIGIVLITGSGASLSDLLSSADAACYVAKERGRNQIHLSEPDDSAVTSRYNEMQWTQRLNSALEENRLILFHQSIRPISSPGNPEIVEILLRLKDDEGSIQEARRFLPAAERYRLMPSLDRWVVEEALDLIAQKTGAQPESKRLYAINLSGQSFGEPEFEEFVLDRLANAQVDPERVCFEITETAAISNMVSAGKFIASLGQRGCRFILDDFGSGLSSFAYLRSLPVQFLKIDGSLVRHVAQDPILREMVTAIHKIGRTMQLSTIAECVESEEALRVVHAIGVDYAQGHHISYPTPLEDS
ncbi:MAG: EAL domain-containing protein [bacterium]|nr:EAL domain-containing protein [bacterium]